MELTPIIQIPLNESEKGTSRTILSGCYKFGSATLIGGGYGATMTSIMELTPIVMAQRGRKTCTSEQYTQMFELNTEGGANTLTQVAKDNLILEPRIIIRTRTEEEKLRRRQFGDKGASYAHGKQYALQTNNTSNAITTVTKDNILMEPKPNEQTDNQPIVVYDSENKPYVVRIRKLTERECFRLMDVDENNIDLIRDAGISKSQQYKMAGNSIVVNVLFHIFRKMFVETENESAQTSLF